MPAFAREVVTVTSLAGTDATHFDIPFPYIAQSHVLVFKNGTQLSQSTASVVGDYQFDATLSSRVILTTPAAIGDSMVFQRETSPGTRLVDYQTGSVLSEEILDQDSLQGFYLAQEANDIKEVAMARNSANNWEAGTSRIINMAAPVDDTDAANKAYVLSATATQVSTATTQAGIATTQAGLAQGYATASAGATSAATTAEQARDDAIAAQVAAEAALTVAGLPSSLSAGSFLQINSAGTGYDLVTSVASPQFFGLKMSANGQEIIVDYGKIDVDVNDYKTWTLGENIAFGVTTSNNLAYTI
tara:strand:- start:975 stop:1880 length:906 start_codon:yes stop_codon:yes gene_type:complete